MISVIIPSYNRINYINQAIDSAFLQFDDKSFVEIIVVDDGSTDGSYELLEQLHCAGKIKLLAHPQRQNKGQSSSINLGISQAQGEYISILDSDDWFYEGKLKQQSECLADNPSIGMVYGKGMAVDADGNELFMTLPDDHTERGDPNDILLNCYIAIPGGALIRKSVLDQVGGFDEGFRAAQDHDMAVRIFEVTDVAYLPEVAFYYRKHEDSISQQGLERRWLIGFEILRRASSRYPYKSATLRKRKAVLHYHMSRVSIQQGRYFTAIGQLVQCVLLDPARSLRVLVGYEKPS